RRTPAPPATTCRSWPTWRFRPAGLDRSAPARDDAIRTGTRRTEAGAVRFGYGGSVESTPDWRSAYDRGDTVCVIGAGASGLLATKNLVEHGFGVDCYDRETSVGGLWIWRHDRSPVYATAHLISSRPATGVPDFPMPD